MSTNISAGTLIKELDNATFTEPFSEGTKKLKKGLILSSFIGIIIGAFSIKIESFLGFGISEGAIGAPVLSGILAVIISYYLVTFLLNMAVDLLAWDFKREIVQVKPYLSLMQELKNALSILNSNLNCANSNLKNIYSNIETTTEESTLEMVNFTSQEIIGISNNYKTFKDETLPSILENKKIIQTISKLRIRMTIRFISLIGLEILIPISICILALYHTSYGFVHVGDALVR